MSNYGVFEASITDGHEEEQRQRQARSDLGRAIEAAREGFGDFLGSSTDKQDYQDRLALVMNDLMQKVADSGVMPVPGVMRKVKAALRPEFRKQASVEELRNYAESLGLSVTDKNGGFTFPTSSGAKGHVKADSSGGYVVQTLIGGSGGMQSSYSSDELDLVKAWIQRSASRKQAAPGFDPNISDENLLASLQIAEALNHDGSNQAKVDELRAEVEARGLTPLKTSRKTAAETFQPGDKVMKSGYPGIVQNEYMDGMYEVKMERGTVVVPAEELTRVSSRKTALKWKDTDFNSWVKMDGGAWSIEVEENGGTFWLYFNGGPADGQMEQLSASSMEEAKAEAESIASSKGITASRKTAIWQVGDRVEHVYDGVSGTVVEVTDGLSGDEFCIEWDDGEKSTEDRDRLRLAKRKQAAAPWETFYTTDIRLDGSESETYTAQLGNGVTLEAFEDPYSPGGWGWSVWLKGDDGIKRYQVGGEANSPDEAKKAAEAASQERKQAGSAQVLQKLENALNDQRSVDVICSNSPDGSFSGEREIPVDEGLRKVRGWISAGDLVDTAQDGGNFFDFEHRASGENVNFYITQEY